MRQLVGFPRNAVLARFMRVASRRQSSAGDWKKPSWRWQPCLARKQSPVLASSLARSEGIDARSRGDVATETALDMGSSTGREGSSKQTNNKRMSRG